MNDERLAVATRWVVIVGVAIVTVTSYWLTFQPGRPFGPIPTLVWLSNFFMGFGAIALGTILARRFARIDRLSTLLAQVGSVLVFATMGIAAGYVADPDWWDFGTLRVHYAFPFIFGLPIIGLSHLAGILKARLFRDE